ncbi:hypothetical protein DPEC_G00174600 [Dallia pectoralis]|uniref:Uncharacterized protein n=1 Tax=Dallia pectoralis TaxID=75939 RepID=A0ACC2GEB0_DALPE|nr:hypothetical protein DPEC_G00174600 [Dallia pectoralis]
MRDTQLSQIMSTRILFVLLTMAVTKQVAASCPTVCECPASGVRCLPGVSAVPDGCGCCQVCAAQLNQDCGPTLPCDHHKGLECNYGNDVSLVDGICRAKKEGRTCEYNGRIYQNGESFRAGCKHQCTCVDGAVGCAPLCDHRLPRPTLACPYPRLIRVPGECCFTVDCHKGTWRLPSAKHFQKPSQRKPRPDEYRPYDPLGNELLENGQGRANELLQSGYGWANEHGYKHLPVTKYPVEKCVVQTTGWSPCSRSCGMGLSSRITNDNARCKMERETRLCVLRPCGDSAVPLKKGKKCASTYQSPAPVRLSSGECQSVRLFRLKYCGLCSDGRCCTPSRARTVPVTFVCPDGERFRRDAMFIQSCKCSEDCGHLNEAALPPQHWMYGDTHKFVD